jgi:hypothetical protein
MPGRLRAWPSNEGTVGAHSCRQCSLLVGEHELHSLRKYEVFTRIANVLSYNASPIRTLRGYTAYYALPFRRVRPPALRRQSMWHCNGPSARSTAISGRSCVVSNCRPSSSSFIFERSPHGGGQDRTTFVQSDDFLRKSRLRVPYSK